MSPHALADAASAVNLDHPGTLSELVDHSTSRWRTWS